MQNTILRIGLILLSLVHGIGLYDNAVASDSGYDLGLPDAYYDWVLIPVTFVVGLFAAYKLFKYRHHIWAIIMLVMAFWWNPIDNPLRKFGSIEIYDPISVWTILNLTVFFVGFYLAWKVEDYKTSH